MIKINKCCNEEPRVLSCDCEEGRCFDCVELIECLICGRIIYGTDEEEQIVKWNLGEDDV